MWTLELSTECDRCGASMSSRVVLSRRGARTLGRAIAKWLGHRKACAPSRNGVPQTDPIPAR